MSNFDKPIIDKTRGSYMKFVIDGENIENNENVVFAPIIETQQIDEEKLINAKILREKYYEKHRFCPKCGSDSYSVTLLGIPIDINKPEAYCDLNRFKCVNCGFTGIVDELV